MTDIILDTHVLIWLMNQDPRIIDSDYKEIIDKTVKKFNIMALLQKVANKTC